MEYVYLAISVAVVIAAAVLLLVRAVRRAAPLYERYKHHGESMVWVRSDLKSLHRDFCLCYECQRFIPGSSQNCPIAHAIYKNCIRFNVVTPVWECPRFVEQEQVTK